MTVVVGTAGHIDHGKTTLLRALTGTDADRLPEEQRRGLTIDLGYAHASPDGGPEVDYVDVPGHDRLIGNMLVGAGEIDACLLVVAADDGPRAQTWEHVELLDALRIRHGLVAVSKTDLVAPDRVAAVVAELETALEPTTIAASPIVPVSASSGAGLDQLRANLAALRDALLESPPRRVGEASRLAIDRVFSIRGRGVVVTGSARGDPITRGDVLRVEPGAGEARVRGLQVHDREVDRGPSGGRLALNLSGIAVGELRRGQELVAPASGPDPLAVTPTDRLLVALHPPVRPHGSATDGAWPPSDGSDAQLHLGTDHVGASVGRAGRDDVELADGRAIAMLRTERPVVAAVGDRLVLRRPAPAGLLAGGIVLDVDPARGRSRRRQKPPLMERLTRAVDAADATRVVAAQVALHGLLPTPAGLAIAADVGEGASNAVLEAMRVAHERHPDQAGEAPSVPRAAAAAAIRRSVVASGEQADRAAADVVASLLAEGRLVRAGELVRMAQHAPAPRDPESDAAMAQLVERLDTDAPPPLTAAAEATGCTPADVRELERSGRIVLVDGDLAWSADAFASLRQRALDLARSEPLTPARLRDATGTSRKYVMALLEDLDRRGILKRTPAGHVPGPRSGEA